MATVLGLVGQIEAASTVLSGLAAVDVQSYEHVASTQRMRLQQNLSSLKGCSLQDLASISKAVSSSSFPPEHKRSLLLTMSALPAVSPVAASESKSQNFEALAEYLPSSVVSRAGTTDFTSSLLQFALRLGLRKPSESTFREISLIALVGGEGMDKALSFSPEARQGMLESTKIWFRKASARMPPASP